MVDAQGAGSLRDASPDLAPRPPLALEWKADIGAHTHVWIEREKLEHKGNVALRSALCGHLVAPKKYLTGRRQLEPGDHAQRRRFAAARKPQQAEELAIRDREARVLHGDEVAEGLSQIFDPDRCHGGHSGSFVATVNRSVPARIVAKDQP